MDRPFPERYQKEFAVLASLKTPQKIQDYLDTIPMNFERAGETCRSARGVLESGVAHCVEGAFLAAAALWYHGAVPLLLDLKTTKRGEWKDDDHVVTLFKYKNRWGALSKTNHGVLRYREPVYASVRELALSYFHEYFLHSGRKTLREYSAPFNLSRRGDEWLVGEEAWDTAYDLDVSRHYKILLPGQERRLRPAGSTEIEAGRVVEWREEGH